MRFIHHNLHLCFAAFLLMLTSVSCGKQCDASEQVTILNDSILNLINMQYSTEDIIAYAYMNTDLGISLRNENTFHDYTLQIINDKRILLSFDWIVYVPKYVCESCVDELCKLLKSENLLSNVGFIIPYELYGNYESLIRRTEMPTENLLYIAGSLGLPIEKEDMLFMFSLSDDYGFQNIYVPNKHLPNLTETYLNTTSLKKQNINNINPIINP